MPALEPDTDAVRAPVPEMADRRCAIPMMGVHLLDHFEFEELCHRWEAEVVAGFLLTVAPPVVRRGRTPSVYATVLL